MRCVMPPAGGMNECALLVEVLGRLLDPLPFAFQFVDQLAGVPKVAVGPADLRLGEIVPRRDGTRRARMSQRKRGHDQINAQWRLHSVPPDVVDDRNRLGRRPKPLDSDSCEIGSVVSPTRVTGPMPRRSSTPPRHSPTRGALFPVRRSGCSQLQQVTATGRHCARRARIRCVLPACNIMAIGPSSDSLSQCKCTEWRVKLYT